MKIKWRERGDMGGGRVRGAVARTSNAAFAEKARRMRAIGDRAAGSGRTGGAEEQGEAQNAEADAGGNAGHVVGARSAVPSYDRAGECDAASIFACPRQHEGSGDLDESRQVMVTDLPLKESLARGARHTQKRLRRGAETPADALAMRFTPRTASIE